MITLQVDLPVQAPDHPVKNAPLPGVAVRVMAVPALNEALHVGEQLIPEGLLVTVPVEVPANTTESSCVVAGIALAAPDTDCADSSLPGSVRAIVSTRMLVMKRNRRRFTGNLELEFGNTV
jgi:hypothetical protein